MTNFGATSDSSLFPYWSGGRVVECTGLENRRAARYRGFESLPDRLGTGQELSLVAR